VAPKERRGRIQPNDLIGRGKKKIGTKRIFTIAHSFKKIKKVNSPKGGRRKLQLCRGLRRYDGRIKGKRFSD